MPAETLSKLVVHLRSASGLRAADRGGTSDPYVKLSLGGVKHKSEWKKETLAPSWNNAKFEFGGGDATLDEG